MSSGPPVKRLKQTVQTSMFRYAKSKATDTTGNEIFDVFLGKFTQAFGYRDVGLGYA